MVQQESLLPLVDREGNKGSFSLEDPSAAALILPLPKDARFCQSHATKLPHGQHPHNALIQLHSKHQLQL